MSNRLRAAVAALVAAVVAVATAGAASADNSNSNTNNNDVTQQGSPNAGNDTGGATEKTNWPPTDLSWPPTEISNGGINASGGKKGGGNESLSATPIVMPSGQTAPTPTAAPSTAESAQPIVSVNTP
jgi:hypothetical protein